MTWNEAVKEGFIQALLDGKTLQKILLVNGTWIDLEKSFFNLEHHRPDEIRVKPEKKRVPLTEEDLPPVFWVKPDTIWCMPIRVDIQNMGICFATGSGTETDLVWRTINYLIENNYVWSPDRKVEHPFWKEVGG